jgi:hypothetical protein
MSGWPVELIVFNRRALHVFERYMFRISVGTSASLRFLRLIYALRAKALVVPESRHKGFTPRSSELIFLSVTLSVDVL